MATEEGEIITSDGWKLYTKLWKTEGAPKAQVVFVHGFSDHCNRYYNTFPTLASRGIEVLGFDQRGWGRSYPTPQSRGLTGPTAQVLSDITTVLTARLAAQPSVPLFLLGHSMGGAEVLTYAASGPADFRGKIRGFIAEGPLIALHPKVEPFKATALAGRAAASLLPNFQLNQQLPPQLICRDPLVVAEYTADPLCHNLGTLVGLRDMLARARDLREDRVKVPEEARVLVLHGGSDSITSAVASEKWVERCKARGMGNVMWKGYPGAYHQLHREPHGVKEQFVEDVGDWILANVA